MRILILTYGSRGDVQPFVALGRALVARGHEVTLGTARRFETFVREAGLGFAPMSDAMLNLLDTEAGRDMMESTQGVLQSLKWTVMLTRTVGPAQAELIGDSWAAAEAVDPDLIVFHPKTYAGPHIAEKRGIPAVLAMLVPMMVPTGERPNVGFPDTGWQWWNRFSYRFVNRTMAFSAGRHVREMRAERGLPKQRRFDLLRDSRGRMLPVLNAVSPSVLPAPRDWPDEAVMTGYWFTDHGDWTPPDELAAFLEAGPPPVYVGFGSMAGRSPGRLAKAVIEALTRTGMRGIIATGWGGLKPADLPDTIHKIEGAPHDWLFPRMAAIVHHGGAGTTAAAIRAGKPQVVVPFFGDQPFWGKIMAQHGVAPDPIAQKSLTADNLAEALRRVTGDPAMAQAAEALGAAVRQEDGLKRAVEVIEAA
ncbi:sterol 3beta-glucosyltransferase [Maritimibacter alkaliphilus HTCC2654]|uniref:Putative UDP-glucose:sterol glucosyltransferase n=1 Tax=Maritimibacter alkaliphilus HTCC2654 TaxID=314271 RepID=A3VBK0_9RHOB|nr:glycosyltransferase [Maritimibacter alkaliphilus]EAQ14333.1 putative UDP-glucose:sterol glucosyltransferase [Rhodobacterales bacterium HTCC2654] [Maritimibacter alkaliphilus HTCC2654]TYP82575.1 sterol 3beta-glucosyltransferase [Maritimibacter alkaliphilus HTCC2654]